MSGLSLAIPKTLSSFFGNSQSPSPSPLATVGKNNTPNFQAKKSTDSRSGGKSMDEMFSDKSGQILKQAMRAVEANTKMKEASAAADATEQWLGKALSQMGRKLEGLLKFMGAKPEHIAQIRRDFTDHFDPEKVAKKFDLTKPISLTESESSSLQLSLEMRDIDLNISAGGKSVAIHFEGASLSLKSDHSLMQVAQTGGTGGTGQTSVNIQQQSTSIMLSSSSLDVNAEGLSEAETKQLQESLPQLFNALSKGGELTAVFAGQGGATTPDSSGVFAAKNNSSSAAKTDDPDALHLSLGITMPVSKPKQNSLSSLFGSGFGSGLGSGGGIDIRL
ncbi:hypothetical protein WCLP8_2800003 [uncultured Gammaproteobacteria bacterium]